MQQFDKQITMWVRNGLQIFIWIYYIMKNQEITMVWINPNGIDLKSWLSNQRCPVMKTGTCLMSWQLAHCMMQAFRDRVQVVIYKVIDGWCLCLSIIVLIFSCITVVHWQHGKLHFKFKLIYSEFPESGKTWERILLYGICGKECHVKNFTWKVQSMTSV